MKKPFTLFFITFILNSLSTGNLLAQNVIVSGALVGNGSYASLSSAFTAINGGAQTGSNISIAITANTTEPVTGAILNSGAWTSIFIQPSGGAARIISGAPTAGTPLISFNGADNVRIDGLNSGGNSLTITNNTVSATPGTGTIRFQSDAVNNVITRCSILGSSTTLVGSEGGNIIIGSNSTSTGNDNNVISFCNIGPAGGNFPSKAVFISGTISSTVRYNSGDTIRNCNIYDYFNSASNSSGIYIQEGSTDITIKDNRFYQTSLRTHTANSLHTSITISNTSGNNFQITGNTIGYANSSGTGVYSLSGSSNSFIGIYLNAGTTTASSVQGNIITALSQTTAASGTTCRMIYSERGLVNITGNTIGSMATTGSIVYSSSSTFASNIEGITMEGSGNNICSNNNIGGITVSNSTTGASRFYSIKETKSSSTTFTCQNNIIGGNIANSIQSTTTSTGSIVNGIHSSSTSVISTNITGNTIRNLTASGGTGVGSFASVAGIVIVSFQARHTIFQNIIHTLKNTNVTDAIVLTGIYYDNIDSSNVISGNFIHSLEIGNQSSVINGIFNDYSLCTFQNNMIRLGVNSSGIGITQGASVNGISETNGGSKYYFNSIYIGGNPTGGSSNTFAFSSTVTTSARNYRNNIFYNARSNNGSTGKHYAVRVGGSSPNPAGLTTNNNVFFVNGTGGFFGLYNGADIPDLSSWQIVVGQDFNSYFSNPKFIAPNGSASLVNLHISPTDSTIIEGNGFNIGSVSDDFDGQTRSSLTPVDIGADAGNFIRANPLVNVIVSAAVANNGSYTTLAAAFAAINGAGQTGSNISITITGNTTEPSIGAILNAGTWTSISIKPSGGAARTISGVSTAGIPLISFNGADNVTIDGINSGGNSLTITNTTVSATAGTGTIRFQSDAVNNVVTRCSVLGSSTTPVGTEGGNIIIGANSTSNGNDNNVISFCNIGPAGGNFPSKAVFISGTTTSTLRNNSGDTIRNCNIYDYFNSASNSSGIYIESGSTDITIKDNRFYQTSLRTHTANSLHTSITISNTSGNNFQITGNTIGYANSSGTGVYSLSGSSNSFIGIYLNAGTTTASSVQGNIITALSQTTAASGLSPMRMIHIPNGLVNVEGNTVGNMTSIGSINFSSSSTATSNVEGIVMEGIGNVVCSNNNIGAITVANSSTGASTFCAIKEIKLSPATFTCVNNTIGGNIANSIQSTTTTSASIVSGILSTSNNVISSSISGNTIRNLTASGGTGTGILASVSGIVINSDEANHYISQNIIHTLKNTHTTEATIITGIFFGGTSGTSVISRNFIHSFEIANQTATINGILTNMAGTIQNNMIRLGINAAGNGLTFGASVNGISETGNGSDIYYNSVYIGGTATAGSSNSYAFSSTVVNDTRNYRNNIFYNARSNSGSTGKHYSIRVGGTSPNPTGLTTNNNVLFVSGTGGVLGLYNGVDRQDMSTWQIAVGQDFNSYNSNPRFIAPNGSATLVNLHISTSDSTIIEGNGFNIVSVSDDYDGQTRSTFTPVDIGADAGNFIRAVQVGSVLVSGSGSNNGLYLTLAAAFTAINNVTQTGSNITIGITGNTTEPSFGAILNPGSWSNISIQPSGGVARTISGTTTAGIPLISFNGADNVTIDGLNSGGNSLIITNTTVSGTAGTGTIRFQSDAVNNVITRCSILGSSTTATGTEGGNIIIGANASSTGNDNNVISFCNIGPAGGNFPSKAVFISGTTSSTVRYNSGDTISNCNIYDYFNSSSNSSGIYIQSGSTDITIKDNKFYQTSLRTHSANSLHTAVTISNGAGNNFQITGNTIGYATSSGTGIYSLAGASNSFIGINLNVGTTTASNVQGNIITALSQTTAASGTSPSRMIYIANGLVNVTNNTIGSMTSTGSIVYNSSSTFTSNIEGITVDGLGNNICSNNNIGGITVSNSSTGASNIYAIKENKSSPAIFTCQNNTIGGIIANSIQSTTTSSASTVSGILSASNSIISTNISGNTIRNLTASGGTGTGVSASVTGILINSGSANHNISQNNIHTLKNNHVTDATVVTGIYFAGSSGVNLISRNFIHSLEIANQTATINGIVAANGTNTFQNNMIRLGIDASGNSVSYGAPINGINETGSGSDFYFNSVYIGGTANAGFSRTFAFASSVASVTRNYKNNIFFNNRINNVSSGKHYAIAVGGTTPNPMGLNLNNNVYFTNDSGDVFGRFNNIDYLNFSQWRNAVGLDSNSFFDDPHFIQPNGSLNSVDMHINSSFPSIINSNGSNISSVIDDYDGETRSELTPVDIGADAGDFEMLFSNDVSLQSAQILNQPILLGNNYDLKATVINLGTNSQNSFPLYYTVNGEPPIGPVSTGSSISQLETKEITFSGIYSLTFGTLGIKTLKIYSALDTDQFRSNDTTTLMVNVQQKISTFPYVETFSNLSNWSVLYENPLYDIPLWELGLATNPTGQNSDVAATSNCYLGAPGRREILKSSIIDLSSFASNTPVLSFYTAYTGYPDLDDSLEVLVSTNNGTTFFSATTLYNRSRSSSPSLATRPSRYDEYFPDSATHWRHEQINLSNVSNQTSVVIGFRSKSDFGNRQWLDNVIVTKANSFVEQTVLSPGIYTFGNVIVDMNTIGLTPSIPQIVENKDYSDYSKMKPKRNKIVDDFYVDKGDFKIITTELDNTSGGKLTFVTYPFQNPIPTFATSEFALNNSDTGVTTGDGSRFTPTFAIPNVYFTTSFTGNDYLGYANYDIKIDVTDITEIENINKSYIMKRSDLTGSWNCLNTTVSGNTLIATGLDNFSEFSIGVFSNFVLNLNMFIEGFYNQTSNSQIGDTILVLLKESISPYNTIDSVKSAISASGVTSLAFPKLTSGTYYVVLKHRNSIETWSANGVVMNQGISVSYNFTDASTKAFGNNLKQIDSSPLIYGMFSGDVNQDGIIEATDLSLIDNAAFNFVIGYVAMDLDGNDFVDASDAAIADNNAYNFVSKITPEILIPNYIHK